MSISYNKHNVFYFAIALLVLVIVAQSCRKEPQELTEDELNETLAGGSQTVFNSGGGAYGQRFPNMSGNNGSVHGVGDAAFEATFVSAPSPINPGLGPIFNSVSCRSCHIADGRGKPPMPGEQLSSMLIRLSIPGEEAHGGPIAIPGFGDQLQTKAIVGSKAEAEVDIQYSYKTYSFPDGETYELRNPSYQLKNSYIPLPGNYMISPRVAPPVFGLGLLEAIPEWAILSNEDINDSNKDGISGKANYGWDELKKQKALGRFGWKAAMPTILQQSAGAYQQDMGITNFIYKTKSSLGQTQYKSEMDAIIDVTDSLLHAVDFYVKTLAVPARRNAGDAVVKRGKLIFNQANCTSCHIATFRTDVNVAFREVSNQTIFPYTDLLLHDMGAGLADNRPDYLADGQEWRTSPLWGIGLTQVVNGHNNFLHDGRARNLTEAIMWHGGEAEQSKQYIQNLSSTDRNALLKFLESL